MQYKYTCSSSLIQWKDELVQSQSLVSRVAKYSKWNADTAISRKEESKSRKCWRTRIGTLTKEWEMLTQKRDLWNKKQSFCFVFKKMAKRGRRREPRLFRIEAELYQQGTCYNALISWRKWIKWNVAGLYVNNKTLIRNTYKMQSPDCSP